MGAMLCEWGKQACYFFLLLIVLSNIVQENIRTIRASKKNCVNLSIKMSPYSVLRGRYIDKPIKFHLGYRGNIYSTRFFKPPVWRLQERPKQWWIHNLAVRREVPTFHFVKFSWKLHEKEEKLGQEG